MMVAVVRAHMLMTLESLCCLSLFSSSMSRTLRIEAETLRVHIGMRVELIMVKYMERKSLRWVIFWKTRGRSLSLGSENVTMYIPIGMVRIRTPTTQITTEKATQSTFQG